jgi:hypothetical protein
MGGRDGRGGCLGRGLCGRESGLVNCRKSLVHARRERRGREKRGGRGEGVLTCLGGLCGDVSNSVASETLSEGGRGVVDLGVDGCS